MMRKLVCALGLLFGTLAQAETLAIVGDSISTGGASHPALSFDFETLAGVFLDERDVKPDQATIDFLQANAGITLGEDSPRRAHLSPREYTHPLSWVGNRFVTSLFSRYLDTEEYSWGFLLGLMEQLEASEVLIAARSGERSQHARQQIDRILDVTSYRAPRHTMIFFTGNDVCAPNISLVTPGVEYERNIESAVRYLMSNAEPGNGTSHIWLLEPMGILQLISSPEILQKKVKAFGKEAVCSDLQAGRNIPRASDAGSRSLQGDQQTLRAGLKTTFDLLLGRGPQQLCPTLFSLRGNSTAQDQLNFGAVLKSYREALDRVAKRLHLAHPSFRVHHLTAPSQLVFAGEDIANDCFHLSPAGQLKIAKAVAEEVRKKLPEGISK